MSESIEEARKHIEDAIDTNGTYTHNIISLTLSSVEKTHGIGKANELVDEFNLTEDYGIHRVSKSVDK